MITKFVVFISAILLSLSAAASPDIQHWQTEQGTRVYFVAAPELPMLDVRLIFDAGAARDGALPGTALMTNAMLDEGTKQADSDAIAASFDNVGANFSTSSERDMALLKLRTLTKKDALEPALAMFTQLASEPIFPEAPFARLKNQLKTRLQAEQQSPKSIGERAFYAALFGDHPYHRMPAGDMASLEKITPEHLQRFFDRYYVAGNATLVLVGAITEQQARKIADNLSQSLNPGDKAAALPAVDALTEASFEHIAFPSSQTHLFVGQPGMTRNDPDYFPLYVGNHILGGSGLVSLISNEIREKRGLSYSSYSYFQPMREAGPYQLGLQTRNAQADEALEVLKQTLTRFVENGPTAEQLAAAKQNITGGFPLRVDSNSKIADYLGAIGFYDLPLDYLETLNEKVNAVTATQIQEAFERRIHPEKMVTVLVGGKVEE
ncbi:Zinc protease [Methylophaga frappieri]|uniref:Zinc protease n=1 Tax=Methylophaga frappieri (strain ATCC BAA-2434 / DSM 25690 / JAM7) TaxID=754477 RepID=I1YFT4_METFJ|nr:pitrilysin family protein [Methylophaga frappieri]AFJ01777.1 Zinc protease [Methylophaga frappieri]